MNPWIQFFLTQILIWSLGLGKRRHLDWGGRSRSFFLFDPQNTGQSGKRPAVLALHGATMNGPLVAWMSGLTQTAKIHDFLLVLPEGTGPHGCFTWNAGGCCGWAMENRIDDVGFLDALREELVNRHRVDPQRVYVCGISNGAMMAYRLAREKSGSIAAIASIAGPCLEGTIRPEYRVPILHFHGTDDQFTPFQGGKGPRSITGCDYPSIKQTIDWWRDFNGCSGNAIESTHPMPHGDLPVKVIRYLGETPDAEVILHTIEQGGHTWPGRRSLAKILGKSALALNANEIMWDFFQRHRRERPA